VNAINRWRAAWSLRECEAVGAGARLHGRPTIYGAPGHIRIGERFHLSSRPIASHLAAGPDGVLQIGDDVAIGHGAAIAAYERVEIGTGTTIGPFVIMMDTNFHGAAGSQAEHHECRPVTIGNNCRIGSRVTITRGTTLGDGAEILAGSVVSGVIPPGMCAAGARARVIGRIGDSGARWDSAQAMLPLILADVLLLDAVPSLTTDPAGLREWDETGIRRVVAAVNEQFAVGIDVESAGQLRSIEDFAVIVEQARHPSESA
jgi:acetyltransferase-like isoleucine patch superfamily enzyme